MIQIEKLALQAFGCYPQGVQIEFSQGIMENMTAEQLQCVCDAITYAVQGNLDGTCCCVQKQSLVQLTLRTENGRYRCTVSPTHACAVEAYREDCWVEETASLTEILGMPTHEFLRHVLCSWDDVQHELRQVGGEVVMQQQNLLYVSGYENVQELEQQLQACQDKQQNLSEKSQIIAAEMEKTQTELQNGLYRITLQEQQAQLQQEQAEIEEIRAYLNHLTNQELQERLHTCSLDWEEQEDLGFLVDQKIEEALRLQNSLQEDVARSQTALEHKQKILKKRDKLEKMIANYHYVKACRDELAREMGESVSMSMEREQLLGEYAALEAKTKEVLYKYSLTYQYELAKALKKGEPGPVCGSTEHPRKRRKPFPMFDFLDLTDHLKLLHRVDLHIMSIDEQIEKYEIRDKAERQRLDAYCVLERTNLHKLQQDLADCKREEKVTERLCMHIESQSKSLEETSQELQTLQQRQEQVQQKLGVLTEQKDILEAELERFAQIEQPSCINFAECAQQSVAVMQKRVQKFDAKCRDLTEQLQAYVGVDTPDFKALQDKIHYLQAQQLIIAHESATQAQTKHQLSQLWERLQKTSSDAPPSLYESNRLLACLCAYQFAWGTQGPIVTSPSGVRQVWDGLTWQDRQRLAMAWVVGKAQVSPIFFQSDWQIAEVCKVLEQTQVAAVLCASNV